VAFRQLGLPGLVAVLAFLMILAVGFLYAWQRGALEWD
jgi:NADH-quinone oxidoreductase subunit A